MKESDKENIEQDVVDGHISNYLKEEIGNANSEPANIQLKITETEKDFLLASCTCDFRLLNTMLSKNANLVNLKSPFACGYSALHFACKFGATDVIRTLVGNYGADVNIIAHSGTTPLHIAVQFKQEDAVRLIMSQYGADKTMRDYSGRLPADLIPADGGESMMKLVGPATAKCDLKPTKELMPRLSSMKKGFQSITANSDVGPKSIFSFFKGTDTNTLGGHHHNHLSANSQLKESGHSVPYSLHAPDMNSIKKSISFMSSRTPAKHPSSIRAAAILKDEEIPRQ